MAIGAHRDLKAEFYYRRLEREELEDALCTPWKEVEPGGGGWHEERDDCIYGDVERVEDDSRVFAIWRSRVRRGQWRRGWRGR